MRPTIAADTLRRTLTQYLRDELAVFWHGTPSPFLTSRLVQRRQL
ncbi:hypothetical protein [Micromonospora sp. WMMD714]|nr:hypothetical protein [Micromonospora sp. WMMD714]WFE65945.1 hypothetical protein O7625_22860 [Micromonospora sp. WMMD714]